MNLVSKLALAAVAVGTFTLATPAQADWHGHSHYYAVRHYWHGRWWGPGYYGPSIFVGSPFYWGGYSSAGYYDSPGYYASGPGVSVGFRTGGYYPRGGYWYHHRYYAKHYRHW